MHPALLAALKVAIIAGGASPQENYNSHAVHVRALTELLESRGIPRRDVTIFWADGTDPAPDRLVRDDAPVEGEWLLGDTPLGRAVASRTEVKDTKFRGWDVQPARRKGLGRWLSRTGRALGPGDTLLLAVTDHGGPDPDDDGDTTITLWGEKIRRSELGRDLAAVPDGVRIVVWMSQCYSGGFADLQYDHPNLCGAFSANPDRVAYGCFPDLAGREEVGHFLRVLEGLGRHGNLAAANDEAMVTDDTPDTLHLTRDAWIFERLDARAEARGVTVDQVVDEAMARAAPDAPERRLAAEVARRYGLGELPDYATVSRRLGELAEARHALVQWGRRWDQSADAARRWLGETAGARPPRRPAGEDRSEARRKLVDLLRAELKKHPGLADRFGALEDRHVGADALDDRTELQEAALIRIAYLYARLAAPQVLTDVERARWDALVACESTPLLPVPAGAATPPPAGPPLPPLAELPSEVAALRPGFYGIQFEDQPEGTKVVSVVPDGPAAQAGLQPGDLVLSVDGEAMRRPGLLRETAFLSRPGDRRTLQVRRDGALRTVTLLVEPTPLPPRPPDVGDRVPELGLTPLGREAPPRLPALGSGRPVVLFFWATWCGPCKKAVEPLAAWARRYGADVIAITSEDAPTVQAFLTKGGAMPFPVALDERKQATRLFDVQASPTFALVGSDGRLVDEAEGFRGSIPLRPPP